MRRLGPFRSNPAIAPIIGVAAVGLAIGLPELGLNCAIVAGRSCFEQFEQSVTAPSEGCRRAAERWLWLPARVPWTRQSASLVAEELQARFAIASYTDCAIGALDERAMPERFLRVIEAERLVLSGSRRLRLDLLGAPIPSPEPGELAFLVGDRRALDEHAFDWTQHYTEKHALAGALLDGRIDRALRLAEHYHGRPNSDARLIVAALDCLSPKPKSLAPLIEVEAARASKRTANFSRHFGEARVVIEACSRLGDRPAPRMPATGPAGTMDRYQELMAFRLRHFALQCNPRQLPGAHGDPMQACTDGDAARHDLEDLERSLAGKDALHHRLELIALVTPAVKDGPALLRLARPRSIERAHVDRVPFTIDEWAAPAEPGAPFIPPVVFDEAAARIGELGTAGDPDKELASLAAVFRLHAARGFALLGKADAAEEALSFGLVGLVPLKGPAQLARSSMEWLLGRPERALSALDPEAVAIPRDRARVLLQRAELLLPDVALAQADLLAAKRDAVLDDDLSERIRWLLLATGYVDASVGEPIDPAGAPSPPSGAGVAPEVHRSQLNAAIALWQSWLRADEQALRAIRYRAWHHRGLAPRGSMAAYLLLASRLAPKDKVERWLDAFFAIDATRVSLSHYAWLRHLAARWRGDPPSAELWWQRFHDSVTRLTDPARAELWRAAGL